jgi:polygalacturonase
MARLATILLLCATVGICGAGTTPRTCNVLDYGAKGDNRTEDTAAVVSAIQACRGGGPAVNTVFLPSGKVFLLRPIRLFSYMEFRLEGRIEAWRDIATWPNSSTQVCSTSPYGTAHPVRYVSVHAPMDG